MLSSVAYIWSNRTHNGTVFIISTKNLILIIFSNQLDRHLTGEWCLLAPQFCTCGLSLHEVLQRKLLYRTFLKNPQGTCFLFEGWHSPPSSSTWWSLRCVWHNGFSTPSGVLWAGIGCCCEEDGKNQPPHIIYE